jgi:HAD superfamily hydrolase (TIGR01509 family)
MSGPAEIQDPRAELSTRRFAAALFDFDETVIDLEAQHTAAHEALCREMGSAWAELPESSRMSSGMRILDDIREMRRHFGWTASEEELMARRQKHFDAVCAQGDLEPLPGVVETIRELQSRGIPLAITSSAVRTSIEAVLKRLGLRGAFALIVDGSDVLHGKPDPEGYLLTARKLGVIPEECLVFEDSHVGVVAAKRAGMFCVAVPNPRAQTPQDVSMADVIVERMDYFVMLNSATRRMSRLPSSSARS